MFHLEQADHSRWSMHSYSHIFVRLLAYASDIAYTRLSSIWAESVDKLKRALSYITCMQFIWVIPPVSNYLHYCEDCAGLFDKLLQSLFGFDTSNNL